MKIYKDSKTGDVIYLEDDVVVSGVSGAYVFTAAHGDVLNLPATLEPFTPPVPTAAELTAKAAAQFATNQSAALAAVDQFAAATLATLTGNVPEVSARTWEMEWGLALLINNAAYTFDPRQSAFLTSQGLNPAPKISAEKAALAAYAVKVIAKGTAFSAMASLTKSLQNSSKAAVLAAIDQPALDAAIAANKAAAQAAIAALPKV